VNGLKYPILQKIARDILAIPVSTVASESAFSTVGRIIDEYRSSLTPIMIEALICTENWLQSKRFVTPIYNLNQELKDHIYQMELQEGNLLYYILYIIPFKFIITHFLYYSCTNYKLLCFFFILKSMYNHKLQQLQVTTMGASIRHDI